MSFVSGTLRWSTVPLKHVAGINERTLREDEDPDLQFRYIDISAVGRGQLVAEPQTKTFGEAPSRARRLLRRGDTLVSTVRTYLRAVWTVKEMPEDLVASTGFAVLSPRNGINPSFLSWWLQSDPFIEEVVATSVGVSYPAINASDLGNFLVPVPTPAEQRAIADFLDTETARIDALIAKKRRMIEFLHERFRSRVDHATSEGRGAPVRRFVSLVTSGPRGWGDLAGNVGSPFIRSANLQRDSLNLREDNLTRVVAPARAEAIRSQVRLGDTVLGITGANTGWVGLVGQNHESGYVSQHVAILRPRGLDPKWLAYSLFSQRAQQQLLAGQYGGTKTQLGLDDLAELVIHVPPIEAQREGIFALDRAAEATARAQNKLGEQVRLLVEHRQALITAAVTGEMEVPGVAA